MDLRDLGAGPGRRRSRGRQFSRNSSGKRPSVWGSSARLTTLSRVIFERLQCEGYPCNKPCVQFQQGRVSQMHSANHQLDRPFPLHGECFGQRTDAPFVPLTNLQYDPLCSLLCMVGVSIDSLTHSPHGQCFAAISDVRSPHQQLCHKTFPQLCNATL